MLADETKQATKFRSSEIEHVTVFRRPDCLGTEIRKTIVEFLLNKIQ